MHKTHVIQLIFNSDVKLLKNERLQIWNGKSILKLG